MTEHRDDSTGFHWDDPRWRDSDRVTQREVERDRRFREPGPPAHKGAIDGPAIRNDALEPERSEAVEDD